MMDFFSAGGFQQLFSDLDEQPTEHDDLPYLPTNLYGMDNLTTTTTTTTRTMTTTLTNDQELKEVENNFCLMESPITDDMYCESEELFGEQKDTISSYAYYDIITLTNRINDAKDNQLNDETHSYRANDWNNNSYHNNDDDDEFHVNEKQLQYSLDLMLPADDEESINEMADWEERFLDNYIEIPELIDFLPEKTPLCTDECELFLRESTKNLKLHRKRKTTTSNGGSDIDRVGYTCSFGNCQKIYAKPAHLKAHLRRHLGEKPYVCNWPDCTWKFSRSDELARHRRSHSGVKPYKCDYCTKCFARSDHLTKHRKVHERRLLAASKAGKVLDAAALPYSILTVRPGRKRKNQIC